MFGVTGQDRARSFAFVLIAHAAVAWLVLSLTHTVFIHTPDVALETFNVRPVEPPPPLPPPPEPEVRVATPRPAGADSAPAPRRAERRAVPRVTPTMRPSPAPAPGGPQSAPDGTGSGGSGGSGSGLGNSGTGSGGGRPVVAPRLTGGRIVPRDYPRAANGDQGTVIAHVAVAADGRVTGCRVARSSGNAVLDATTCRLIRERFRFNPARNARGEPVAGEFGWQQRWWRD